MKHNFHFAWLICLLAFAVSVQSAQAKSKKAKGLYVFNYASCLTDSTAYTTTVVWMEKAEAELHRLEGFLLGIQKKLSNERFVNNAPAAVVEMERKKQADTETKMAALRDSLAAWKKA